MRGMSKLDFDEVSACPPRFANSNVSGIVGRNGSFSIGALFSRFDLSVRVE